MERNGCPTMLIVIVDNRRKIGQSTLVYIALYVNSSLVVVLAIVFQLVIFSRSQSSLYSYVVVADYGITNSGSTWCVIVEFQDENEIC